MGLDIGTSGCKAAMFDAEGALLALAQREYPLLTPHSGWAELDSEGVCDACLAVIGETAAARPDDPVIGLGISCQGEAFTPVAADGRILANGMVSSDVRAAPMVAPFSDTFGAQRLYQFTGHTPHPMFTLYKLLWLRENRPDIWRAAAKFYCFEELIQHRLGVEPAISWPLAGRTMLFDVRRHEWRPEILSAVGLEASRLAPPAASGTVVGAIARSVAKRLGLPDNVQVVAGGHDQPCGALGAGIVEPSRAMYATGSVECICPAFERPIFNESLFRANLCTYDYAVPGMYTTVAFSLTGGNLLRWFRDQWAQSEVAEAARTGADPYDLILRGMAAEPTDLLTLPYFTPSGTPHFDAKTPGAIVGLRLTSTRGQVLRALLEGVCLEMRLNVDVLDRAGLRIGEFRAIGGGGKKPRPDATQGGRAQPSHHHAGGHRGRLLGRGDARLHRAHRGQAGRVGRHWVKPGRAIEPDPRRAAAYDERFAAYRALYPAICSLASAHRG